ncbi:hypothetical protein AVEN_50622-1 [Araneus ventricosus]|uniref:Uncharacterized protein n=1 Tax=Araneus ventricosus TaxID=182803 RepID=A0A4Y2ASA2_ARAVE|nr:hypothetical protein AVEN_50622-1 [Araneus ventricosus]
MRIFAIEVIILNWYHMMRSTTELATLLRNFSPQQLQDVSTTTAYLKLGIHHRSVPIHLEGFLADRFHFQPIKFGGLLTGRTVPTVNSSPVIP